MFFGLHTERRDEAAMVMPPRTDMRCGLCRRQLAFFMGSWRHTDDETILCTWALPYIDPELTPKSEIVRSEFGRVDFTYWPQTDELEWHGHPVEDLEGVTKPMSVPFAEVERAVAAFLKEMKKRKDNAAWFAQVQGGGCSSRRR